MNHHYNQQIMSNCSNKKKTNSRYPAPKLQVPKKVTLTDLCPEQKGKIGELILLIEKHRQENNNLSIQNKGLKQSNRQLTQKTIRLEFEKNKHEERVKELSQIINDLQQHFSKKDKQLQKYEKKVQKIVQHRQIQADFGRSYVQQTNKVTTRDISVNMNTQTQQNQFSSYKSVNNSVHNVSKSGQKNNPKIKSKKHSKAYKRIMDGINSISKAVEDKLSRKESKSIHNSISRLSEQQDFSNLARAWMQMKKQNGIDRSISRPYKSVDSMQQSGYYDKLVGNYTKLKESNVVQQTDEINQFDLNAMLKRKNFKANQILRSAVRSEKDNKTIDYF